MPSGGARGIATGPEGASDDDIRNEIRCGSGLRVIAVGFTPLLPDSGSSSLNFASEFHRALAVAVEGVKGPRVVNQSPSLVI